MNRERTNGKERKGKEKSNREGQERTGCEKNTMEGREGKAGRRDMKGQERKGRVTTGKGKRKVAK
jgi:hypothetical protein